MRERISELKELVPSLRLLGREGFCLVDAKTSATIASLHSQGVFAAGATLVGSHAYGVLLNRLGARALPYATFKQRGRSPFHVDLLAPASGEEFSVIAAPELKAHAAGLPYLGYLLAESQSTVLLARTGCCAVLVPVPERFAIHKLLVSHLRTGRQAKSAADLSQAAVLCAVLADTHPGALEAAVAAIPRRAKTKFSAALESLRALLDGRAPRALEELGL